LNIEPSVLERAVCLTAFKVPKLRNKIRKIPRDAWRDPTARDFAMRLVSNQPIFDQHIADLGAQVIESTAMESAVDEIVNLNYIDNAKLYARNILARVEIGDVDGVIKAMDDRPSTVGMGGSEHLSEIIHDLLAMAQAGVTKDNSGSNISIPFNDWNDAWGGIAGGSLHVIGADPGGAKSAVVEKLDLAEARPDVGVRVGSMSMEMPRIFKLARYAQHLYGADVGPKALLSGKADMDLLQQALRELQEYSIFVDDTKYQRYGLIDAMYAMKDQHDIQYFSVDFLQLMSPYKGEARYDSVTDTINALYDFARDVNTGVILISQLNREGRKLAERPRMTDLQGSGAIEQVAWTVNFLWDKDRISATKGSDRRVWVIDKNRNGPAPVILGDYKFDGATMDLAIP